MVLNRPERPLLYPTASLIDYPPPSSINLSIITDPAAFIVHDMLTESQ